MIGDGIHTYSDSSLTSMKKKELIRIIRILEKNLRVAHEKNETAFEEIAKLNAILVIMTNREVDNDK